MSVVVQKARSATVTGRKIASPAPASVRRSYPLDPRGGMRDAVARLATPASQSELRAMASSLREPVRQREGETVGLALRNFRAEELGGSTVVLSVHRIPSPRYGGYPLRRTSLITLNREENLVIAEIREITHLLGLIGRGPDAEAALESLALQFETVIDDKIRIPPHERQPGDKTIVAIINHMVDWETFRRENPAEQPVWGRIVRHQPDGSVRVRWVIGPGGIRDLTTALPARRVHPLLREMAPSTWFLASVREYPDRLEWIEPPRKVPNPNHSAAARAAWDDIPTVVADEPGVWPTFND